MKKVLLSYLRWAVLAVLFFFVCFASISSEFGEWYAIFIYPWVSKFLSAISSLVSFSLDEWVVVLAVLACGTVPFYWRLVKHKSWRRIIALEVESLLWIYVWFYWAWGLNYDRFSFYQRAEVKPVAYNERSFQAFLAKYTDGLNGAFCDCMKEGWMNSPDLFRPMDSTIQISCYRLNQDDSLQAMVLNDSTALDINKEFSMAFVHSQIKEMYQKVPARYGLCRPQVYQHPKRSLFNGLYSNVGVLGFMGPFFSESHVNLELSVLEYPFTYAHELSHLLGISSEAEANLWAYTVCTASSHPLIQFSGYIGLLSYVRSNAYLLLRPDDFEKWESSIASEILAVHHRVHAYWAMRYNPTLGNMQSKLYEFYLKRNKISSGQKNYAQVVGMLLSLPNFEIGLE